jgi:hypothetical protein
MGSGNDRERHAVSPPMDAVFASVGVRGDDDDAVVSTSAGNSDSGNESLPMRDDAHLELEAEALRQRLRLTREDLDSLGDLNKKALDEVLQMRGGLEQTAESLRVALDAVESLDSMGSLDAMENSAARAAASLAEGIRKASCSDLVFSEETLQGDDAPDADLDSAIAAAEAKLYTTRLARDEARKAVFALEGALESGDEFGTKE